MLFSVHVFVLVSHPFSVSQCTVDRIGSFCVSIAVLVSWLLENAVKDIALTRRSSLISVLFALEGKWLSASASNISLPGRYIMTMSYCCNLNNILCNLTGAEIRFFKQIISNGLWSLSTTNDLPYRYVWNFLQPNTKASSSHLMFAYLVSVSVKLLLAKAMGLPSYKMQAPRPFNDASHCKITGLFLL